jgi:hypothetical protein
MIPRHFYVAIYLDSENVQVAVGVRLSLSGPTQAAGNVIASVPETDDAVADRVPVPENEHPGDVPAWFGTLKVTDVSCDPETVPIKVVLRVPSPALSTIGPDTLAPLCVAVHERIGTGRGSAGILIVPVQVPARLSVAAGGGVGAVGVLSPPHARSDRLTLATSA